MGSDTTCVVTASTPTSSRSARVSYVGTVTEVGHVVDDLADSLVVRGAHDIDVR